MIVTNNGNTIGPAGLGTFPLRGESMKNAMLTAIKVGYRLFDSSDDYQNEDGIGAGLVQCLKEGIATRDDLFLQTKVSDCDSYLTDYRQNAYFTRFSNVMNRFSVRSVVRSKVMNSLKEMNTGFLDSVLLHFPYPGFYEEMWDALIELKKEGVIRYIGVSNFSVRELEPLMKTEQKPQINEVYISPYGTKKDLVDFCNNNDIQLMTYSPLGVVRERRFMNDVITSIMNKYNKSMAQVILRWNSQVGSIPLPKSSNETRLKENYYMFDFELTPEEMNCLNSLNINHQYLPISKECPGL